MLAQEIVDLERSDLVAAARDDVFARAAKLDVSGCRRAREIAGLEVSLVERGMRQFRIIQIAEHAEWSTDLQLAGFPGRDRTAIPHEPKHDALGRFAYRAEAPRLIGGAETEIAGTGFGQAIEIMDGGARKALHRMRKFWRKHLAAGQDQAQPRRARRGFRQQRPEHRGDAG